MIYSFCAGFCLLQFNILKWKFPVNVVFLISGFAYWNYCHLLETSYKMDFGILQIFV